MAVAVANVALAEQLLRSRERIVNPVVRRGLACHTVCRTSLVSSPGGLRSERRVQESNLVEMTWPRISPAGNLAVCMFA